MQAMELQMHAKGYENTPLKSKGYQLQLHSKGYKPLLSKTTYEIWQETQVHKPGKVTKTLACPKIIKSGPRKICLVANYPRIVSGLVHPSDLHGIFGAG